SRRAGMRLQSRARGCAVDRAHLRDLRSSPRAQPGDDGRRGAAPRPGILTNLPSLARSEMAPGKCAGPYSHQPGRHARRDIRSREGEVRRSQVVRLLLEGREGGEGAEESGDEAEAEP